MYNFNAPSIATPIPPSTRKPPTQKDTSPSGHEIYNFGRRFLGYHYYILNLSVPCSRDEERERGNIAFSLYDKITSPWDGGSEIYKFLFPYPTDATYQIW